MTDSIPDSLPYIDVDIDNPELKAKVDAEIARELKRVPKNPDDHRIPPEIKLFANNALLAAELERVSKREPLHALDSDRYSLSAPSKPDVSEDEWTEALNNAYAQQEHQRSRLETLSLLQNYGSNAWRLHNYMLEADAKAIEADLERARERVTEINRERKNSQLQFGKTLNSLENRWTELVSNVIQLELANASLEVQVEELRQQELAFEES
ncbi:breast carcinoma amplified sequence 2 [Cantharellus anzutake]|uniref:breast carcinoma amplified sequence 2 n=1 Tax=Cantharellus anzutake TaxID=1750568 RepID=UPI001907C4B7|nr:breast carcinoma amplified sequence 2 [Cantharellus anzutake]KAF8334290.1 breast carcinoma amplified sequence 2 [Cantharellus anzutake]